MESLTKIRRFNRSKTFQGSYESDDFKKYPLGVTAWVSENSIFTLFGKTAVIGESIGKGGMGGVDPKNGGRTRTKERREERRREEERILIFGDYS